jgi:glutamyl-tRNA reductase
MRNPRYGDGMRHHELDRALRLLRRGEDPARVLEELSRRLMNKLIHAPTKTLRDAA